MEPKQLTSMRLSREAKRLIAAPAQKLSISQAAVLELAIREKAKREGVK
jgi:PIN domain nuclease of toxin-antitoxin system